MGRLRTATGLMLVIGALVSRLVKYQFYTRTESALIGSESMSVSV
jgi:hypothetical protein